MVSIRNVINRMNILCAGSYKFFPLHYSLRKKFLKRILTYLYCIKLNKINMCHTEAQKHVSYTGSRKRILIYYGSYIEMAGYVF